jgi:phosphoribosylanthranilate isomerase
VKDCALATSNGADFIGMILWPKSKRSVTRETARDIAAAAKEEGAIPVAVFVDEDAATIVEVCDAIGVDHAQLHGDGARDALEKLPMRIKAIWVLNADAEGKIVTKFPGDEEKLIAERTKKMSGPQGWKAAIDFVSGPRRVVDWLLIDGVNAGSGTAFDWKQLKVPRGCSRKGWLLAGGLNPENVGSAVETVNPNGVDVASGVADDSGVVKEEAKIVAFIGAARAAGAKLAAR